MSDATATMGSVLPDSVTGRDAVHVAVIAVEAASKLVPGQDVGLDGTSNNAIGIVDPFLKSAVAPGSRFWLFLYPRTITSLRHEWTHPAVTDAPLLDRRAVSEKWLRDFVSRSDCPGYEATVAAALAGGRFGDEYLHFDGMDAHGEIPAEFWDHIENVTGAIIPHDKRPSYFSCSC